MKTVSLAVLAALCGTPAFARDACLRINDVRGWTMPNDKTLIVEDFEHRKFRLTLLGICDNLKARESLAFHSIGGTTASCLETGDQVLTRDFPSGISRCTVTKIEAGAN